MCSKFKGFARFLIGWDSHLRLAVSVCIVNKHGSLI